MSGTHISVSSHSSGQELHHLSTAVSETVTATEILFRTFRVSFIWILKWLQTRFVSCFLLRLTTAAVSRLLSSIIMQVMRTLLMTLHTLRQQDILHTELTMPSGSSLQLKNTLVKVEISHFLMKLLYMQTAAKILFTITSREQSNSQWITWVTTTCLQVSTLTGMTA